MMMDDAKEAKTERGFVPPARIIDVKATVKGTPEVVQSFQLKINQQYEATITNLKNAPIVVENEKLLFSEVVRYLQIEKNVRKAKISKVFSYLGDIAAQLIKITIPPAQSSQEEEENLKGNLVQLSIDCRI